MFETSYSEIPFRFELLPIKLCSVSFQKSGNNLIDNISLSIYSKGGIKYSIFSEVIILGNLIWIWVCDGSGKI